MKKALITGVAGFAGSHLAEYLIPQKIKVFGTFHPNHSVENVEHLKSQLQLIAVNLLKRQDVEGAVSTVSFDYIFHLAAFSSPAKSFENPTNTLKNNILSQINLLESLAKIGSKAKILIIGSADEYGDIDPKYLPATEITPLAPISPYAVSKVVQDMLGHQYFLHHRLKLVRVRPFNHIGPRQSISFVVPAFASKIAALERQGGGIIKVGNLDSWRDFTDVRDVVRAYLLALEKCSFGDVYNIGSGKPVEIRDILGKLISLSKVKIKVIQDKKLLSPVEIKKIYCDSSKFQKQTGWFPKIDLLKSLSDTIEYERRKLT